MLFVTKESICVYAWLFAAMRLGWAEDVPVNNAGVTDVIRTERLLPGEESSLCLVPPQPMNGQWKLHREFCDRDLDCDIPQGIQVRNGSHLVYNCNPGYSIEGSSDVYCTNRGRWSPIPSCVPNNVTQCHTPRCLVWGEADSRRDDYTYTPGIGAHKLHTRALVWNDARAACQDEGGYLAVVNSVAEAKAITELFKNSEPIVSSPHPDLASIGFHDLYSEGHYVTIHDQSLGKAGFTRWVDGQPDNAGGSENCGSFHKTGGLNDINCGTKFGFICERPVY